MVSSDAVLQCFAEDTNFSNQKIDMHLVELAPF